MTQDLILKLRGLYVNPNSLSEVPDGALAIADNIVIDKESVGESRRGQTFYGDVLAEYPSQLFNYKNRLLAYKIDESILSYDSDGAGTWIDYVLEVSPPITDNPYVSGKIKSVEANKNFYLTTDEGIKKLDNITGPILSAGIPKALDGEGATSGVIGFMTDNTAVAYRLLWGYNDANKNLILGSPSQPTIVANTSGFAADVELLYYIPEGVEINWIYQLYRSGLSATAADVPNDELQLVVEGSPTSTDLSNGYIEILDQTPNSVRGATLYTSPSQEGIANENHRPPLAIDMTVYKNHTIYANTVSQHRKIITLVSVDSPSLTYISETGDTTLGSDQITDIGDTSVLRVGMRAVGTGIPVDSIIVTIDSPTAVTISEDATANGNDVAIEFQDGLHIDQVDYWAGSAQDIPTNTFLLENGGTPGENILATALSIIRVVNLSADNDSVYAYYLSGYNDFPGQMLFEERAIGGPSFVISSTSGVSFNPILDNQILMDGDFDEATPTVLTDFSDTSSLRVGMLIQGVGIVTVPSTYIVSIDSSTQITISLPQAQGGTGTNEYTFYPTSMISDNETKANRIYISKPLQPEAVPIYRYLDVGSANAPIRRILALRDSSFILKDDGIYKLTGEDINSFAIISDNTTVIIAPESAVTFNNQVFCFSDQGIIGITESGVTKWSRPIENLLSELSSLDNFEEYTFGVSYESEGKYILYTISGVNDTCATQAFVYNSFTNSWTCWKMNRTCGLVNDQDNKLYMGHPTNDSVYKERKDFTRTDYADEEYEVTITNVDEDVLTLSSTTVVTVGMTIQQDFLEAIVTAIDNDDITVNKVLDFTNGAATVYTPILYKLQWTPIDLKNPGLLKQFVETTFIFRDASFDQLEVSFGTNFSSLSSETIIEPDKGGGWGTFPWGTIPWGGIGGGMQPIRTLVPLEKQRANWLNMGLEGAQAFTSFSLEGVSLIAYPMNSRFK
jgi:hypothetical protein